MKSWIIELKRSGKVAGTKISWSTGISAAITEEDIDDIMVSALEGGITYWADGCEVVGKYLGEYASEQISRGGALRILDESGEKHWLNLDKFLKGFVIWASEGYDQYGAIRAGRVDTTVVDGAAADCIIQLALFEEVVYG